MMHGFRISIVMNNSFKGHIMAQKSIHVLITDLDHIRYLRTEESKGSKM
jgi:hypothetical protein